MMKHLLVLFALLMGITQSTLADGFVVTQAAQPGQTIIYTVDLHNDTTVSQVYQLSASGFPSSMTVAFLQDGPLVETVTIPAHQRASLQARIAVGGNAAVGEYHGTLTATRDDKTIVELPLVLNVENTYSLRIVSQNLNVNTFSGQEFSFDAVVSNTGAAPLTHVTLNVKTPARWVIQTEPLTLPSLEAGANHSFTVHAIIPSTQAAIEQALTFAAQSDQANSLEASILVRVQTSPNFFLYAGLISIIAIGGTFFYFRLKGRR